MMFSVISRLLSILFFYLQHYQVLGRFPIGLSDAAKASEFKDVEYAKLADASQVVRNLDGSTDEAKTKSSMSSFFGRFKSSSGSSKQKTPSPGSSSGIKDPEMSRQLKNWVNEVYDQLGRESFLKGSQMNNGKESMYYESNPGISKMKKQFDGEVKPLVDESIAPRPSFGRPKVRKPSVQEPIAQEPSRKMYQLMDDNLRILTALKGGDDEELARIADIVQGFAHITSAGMPVRARTAGLALSNSKYLAGRLNEAMIPYENKRVESLIGDLINIWKTRDPSI